MKTTKGACYTVAAALMLASAPLILALPASGAPCGPVGGIVPGLLCPEPPGTPGHPKPTTTPVPTASATTVPASPTAPPVTPRAPRSSAPSAPASPSAEAPTAAPGTRPPAGNSPITSPAAGGAPGATRPAAVPTATARPVAAEPTPSGGLDGRSIAGALLLALGGLLAIVWFFLDIRT